MILPPFHTEKITCRSGQTETVFTADPVPALNNMTPQLAVQEKSRVSVTTQNEPKTSPPEIVAIPCHCRRSTFSETN